MVIGVSGKYCAGKNVVTALLQERGFSLIDVDALGHQALIEREDCVVSRFGAGILSPAGGIDRRELGKLVFGNVESRKALEAIVHPWMKDMVARTIEGGAPGSRWVINAALLFYMDLHSLCDAVFWVRSSFFTRFSRALKRDNLSRREVLRRFLSQIALSPQSARNHVDIYTIDNSRGTERLAREVDRVLESFV